MIREDIIIMDFSKAKFEILKIEGPDDLGFDSLNILHIIPEQDHLTKIGSGQYSLEEGYTFGCESEEDMEKYEEILDNFDYADPIEVEKAYKALEDAGFVNLGLLSDIKVFKRIKQSSEYTLVLCTDGDDSIISIATSSKKSILQQYKKLIDTPITRFKLGLIADSDPSIIGSKKELYLMAEEEALFCKSVLNQMNL